MKLVILSLALAAGLMLTGCSDLVSLNPVITDQQAIRDSNLPGTWRGDEKELYIIQQDGAGYSITYTESKGTSVKFTGMLFKAGDAELMDLVSEDDGFLQVPVHTVMRIWLSGNQLQFRFLDTQWLRDLATQQLPSQPRDKSVILTSPTDALRAFYLKYGADPNAFEGDPKTLTRM